MTPHAIVARAKELGIDILGISDHNSTKQVALVKELAEREGIFVLQGAEVNTKEDVHCLCFFPTAEVLNEFQNYIDLHCPNIPNRPESFGDQIVINEAQEIVYEEHISLLSAINQSIEQLEEEVHRLGGIFIPAHVNRKMFAVCTQLGFIPPWLKCDAIEIFPDMPLSKHLPKGVRMIQNSDAHIIEEIGQRTNEFDIEEISFDSIKAYLTSPVE